MTAIKIDKFGGMIPAWDSRLLPEGQSDLALNTYLYSGALTGWRRPKRLRPLNNQADHELPSRVAFRIPSRETGDTNFEAADLLWMEFYDPETTFMLSPVVDDSFNRVYFANTRFPPRYISYDNLLAELNPYFLGIPAPAPAPTVTVAGGGEWIFWVLPASTHS